MLEKRTPPPRFSPNVLMRMSTFKSVAIILPVTEAARYLEEFYSSIAANAAGAWRTSPQEYSYTMQQGPFTLMFTSMGDTIPWNFVREMAQTLWTCASAGLAELFEVVYIDDAGKIAVAVSLSLLDGDGSSGSAGTDYNREGSVPSVGTPYDNP